MQKNLHSYKKSCNFTSRKIKKFSYIISPTRDSAVIVQSLLNDTSVF